MTINGHVHITRGYLIPKLRTSRNSPCFLSVHPNFSAATKSPFFPRSNLFAGPIIMVFSCRKSQFLLPKSRLNLVESCSIPMFFEKSHVLLKSPSLTYSEISILPGSINIFCCTRRHCGRAASTVPCTSSSPA